MADCLDDDAIIAFVEGRLDPQARERAQMHVASCVPCRLLVAEAAKGLAAPLDAEPATEADAVLEVGARVGRYEIVRLVGAGGAGLVYEAFDPQLSRRVALKVLRPDRDAGAEAAARLLREAKAMAQLSHPHVVSVYDAGTFARGVFIAMELVDGTTLARWLADARPDWRTVVRTFVSAGQGLLAAHAAGLVHRDFKPENVLLGPDGRPRVTDFGLARPASLDDDPETRTDEPTLCSLRSALLTLTQAGALAGTPAYMAPEQFRGAHADESTDQFNFCASLYVALYRQLPFATEPQGADSVVRLARAVTTGNLREPPQGAVPAAVYAAIARGLSRERAARWPKVADLLEALERAARPRSWLRRPWTWVAAVSTAAAASALTLAAVRAVPSSTPRMADAPTAERPSRALRSPPADPEAPQQDPSTVPSIAPVVVEPPRSATRRAPSARRRAPAPRARAVSPETPRPVGDGLKDPFPGAP